MPYTPVLTAKPSLGYVPVLGKTNIPTPSLPLVINSIFGETAQSIPATLPADYQPIQKAVGGFAADIGRSIASNIASAGLTIAGKINPTAGELLKAEDFHNYFSQGLFETVFGKGKEVKSIEQRIAEAEPKVDEWKKALQEVAQTPGLNVRERFVTTVLANLDVPSVAFMGIMGSVGLDLTPFGGLEKGAFKAMIEVKTIGEGVSVLTKMGVAEDLARQFAQDVVKVIDEKSAKALFTHIAEVQQKTTAVKEGIAGRRGLEKVGLAPEISPTISRTEESLLKSQIRAEARTAKTVAKDIRRTEIPEAVAGATARVTEKATTALRQQELSSFRKLIRERFSYEKAIDEVQAIAQKTVQVLKNKAKDFLAQKAEIVGYIRTRVSPELRGRLLSAMATAKTQGNIASIVRRTNILRNEEIKKEIIGEVEKIIEKVDSLPKRQQERIVELTDNLTSRTFSEKTQKKLADLKDFLSREPSALFKFGAKTLKKTELAGELGKQNIRDVPIRDLIGLHRRLEHIAEQGKVVGRVTAETKALKVDNALKEIAQSSRNLDKGLPAPRKPGTPVPATSFAGAKDSIVEGMRKGVQYYASPDVGFQILDKGEWFGSNWRIFKAPMDEATDLSNEVRNTIIDNLFVKIKDIEGRLGKLKKENYERVMLWATLRQTGGRAKLLKTDPRMYTDTFLDSIKLNDNEREFYNLGRSIFDELRPQIEKVTWATRGEKLGKVDNYWSWVTDFNNSDELFQRLSGDFNLRTRTEQGFIKTRSLAGTQRINLDALEVLTKHISDATDFIHKEELLNHLSQIARSDKYAESVGKIGQKWTAGWLDLIARGGTPKGYQPGPVSTIIRNIGHGVLGFKLSPIVKQPLSMIVATGFLGKDSRYMFDGSLLIGNFREGIHKISKQQLYRSFDDPVYTQMAKSKRLKQWQEWGYKGIKAFDSFSADSVWYAAYRKSFNDRRLQFNADDFRAGKADKTAKEYADLITRRTQGSSEYKDAPLLYSVKSDKDYVMALLQFQRFIHNQSLLWRDAKVALLKEKDPIKAAAIATSLVAAGIAEGYITTGIAQIFGSQETAKGERERHIVERVFSGVVTNLPVISNLTSMVEYGGSGVPAMDVFRRMIQGGTSVVAGKKTETKIKGGLLAAESVAEVGGISGASQVGQLIRKAIPVSKPKSKANAEILKKYGIEAPSKKDILEKYNISIPKSSLLEKYK